MNPIYGEGSAEQDDTGGYLDVNGDDEPTARQDDNEDEPAAPQSGSEDGAEAAAARHYEEPAIGAGHETYASVDDEDGFMGFGIGDAEPPTSAGPVPEEKDEDFTGFD
jgi:hypothetical protein